MNQWQTLTRDEMLANRSTLRQAAIVTCLSNYFLSGLLLWIGGPALLSGMVFAHATLAAVIWAEAVFKRGCDQRWITTADALLFLPYFVTIWAGHDLLGRLAYDPLFASKILAVGLAALVPSSFRLHLGLMAGVVLQAAAIWMALARQAAISKAEPWLTILFFLVAGWFLIARWQQHEFEKELAELRIKAQALTRVAQTFVAVRHLANTPLQKIKLLNSLLQQGETATPERLAALEHALGELENLLDEFRVYENIVEQGEEEISIDAYAKLARMRPR